MNFFERIRGTKKRKEAQESGIIYSPLKVDDQDEHK